MNGCTTSVGLASCLAVKNVYCIKEPWCYPHALVQRPSPLPAGEMADPPTVEIDRSTVRKMVVFNRRRQRDVPEGIRGVAKRGTDERVKVSAQDMLELIVKSKNHGTLCEHDTARGGGAVEPWHASLVLSRLGVG